MTTARSTASVTERAGRASGAMVFAIFGGACCALWALRTSGCPLPAFVTVAATSALLFGLAAGLVLWLAVASRLAVRNLQGA